MASGDNFPRAQVEDGKQGFFLQTYGIKSSFLADVFASISFTVQHGIFQRLFLDLSRYLARLDIPSGFKFLSDATSLSQDILNSQKPIMEAVQVIFPDGTLSLQQQEPVFALEYALQVIGSAKAVAWYCPKRQEFLAELRFYET